VQKKKAGLALPPSLSFTKYRREENKNTNGGNMLFCMKKSIFHIPYVWRGTLYSSHFEKKKRNLSTTCCPASKSARFKRKKESKWRMAGIDLSLSKLFTAFLEKRNKNTYRNASCSAVLRKINCAFYHVWRGSFVLPTL
jgi:hypothetical protein